MPKLLCPLLLLASVLALPLAAHADAVDDFMLTGGGQTITYSLPATSSFPDYDLFNFFSESAPTTVNGVAVGVVAGDYYVFPPNPVFGPTLVLNVADTAGNPALILSGPQFFSVDYVPASNPPPYLPVDVVPTFTPGTYTLQNYGSPFNPLSSPISYTLTITQETPTATTPEPPSLPLLATGALGFMGFAAMKRRHIGLSS
jgi:hypothetical protein